MLQYLMFRRWCGKKKENKQTYGVEKLNDGKKQSQKFDAQYMCIVCYGEQQEDHPEQTHHQQGRSILVTSTGRSCGLVEVVEDGGVVEVAEVVVQKF